ncbi:MAG: resuscitation-promoting factor RpfB [Frankiaceae bacterium]|nr:resuscitation-promoting factor RpfB [Frankiaceae bacterium]
MRRSPLTIALFAVVILALGGGATAFAMMDKTVRVDVDGQQASVRTFASNVAGVLRKAHLVVGPHDTVAPDLSAPVKDGSKVVVRHGRQITVTVNGKQRQVWVTALSVDDALDQLGLRTDGEWLSASRSLSIPRQGLSLTVRLPQHVTILADGRRKTVDTTAPDVRTLLHDLKVKVGRMDRVSVPLTRYPTSGLVITIDRVSQKMVSQSVVVPFRTLTVKTSSLYVGQSKITRYGTPGVRLNTYRLVWKNHKLMRRVLVSSVIKAKSIPQHVEVGTKPKPRYSPTADGLNWSALARCESGGNPRSVSSDGRFRGLYQFTIGTWQGVGGSGDPIDASSSEQTYRAQILYRRSGDSPWPTCGHYLYT